MGESVVQMGWVNWDSRYVEGFLKEEGEAAMAGYSSCTLADCR